MTVRRRYASGKYAKGQCGRTGEECKYHDLVEDGHVPGLLVAWWNYEPPHPAEQIPVPGDDAQALRRPTPRQDRIGATARPLRAIDILTGADAVLPYITASLRDVLATGGLDGTFVFVVDDQGRQVVTDSGAYVRLD